MNQSSAAQAYQKQQDELKRQREEMREKAKDFDFISMMLQKLGGVKS